MHMDSLLSAELQRDGAEVALEFAEMIWLERDRARRCAKLRSTRQR